MYMISGPRREFNAIITIAQRDVLRLLRDPARVVAALILPVLFVGLIGAGFQGSFGQNLSYNLVVVIFTGIFAQTLFQSTASGIISLIEDRENNFSQAIFISPISRYSIVVGKIIGESLVAFVQAIAVLLFGLVVGIPFTPLNIVGMLGAGILVCLIGGSFGVLLLSLFGNQRAANQIMPFLIFPQFFLAGIFNPLVHVPWYLMVLSKITPLTYGVDLVRNAYYAGRPEYSQIIIANPLVNIAVMAGLFMAFVFIGTALFVNSERNR
jgi:ABC-2 type transport system permease protein